MDIYQPKVGESWESIAREYYNDAKYAPALRAYNRDRSLQGGSVDVPPIHVLRRVSTSGPAQGFPVGRTGGDSWGAAVSTGGGTRTFRVPDGGLSLPAIAKLVLGSEQRWTDIYDLNPQFTKADEILPAGTELKLPADARPPG